MLPICGCDEFSGPVAEDKFEQDAGGRADEDTPFAKFRQVHLRIGEGEPVELAAHRLMVVQAKGDMIDRLARAVDRTARARKEVHIGLPSA